MSNQKFQFFEKSQQVSVNMKFETSDRQNTQIFGLVRSLSLSMFPFSDCCQMCSSLHGDLAGRAKVGATTRVMCVLSSLVERCDDGGGGTVLRFKELIRNAGTAVLMSIILP